jgi:polyhydroxyalkanoate synthesis regulator phasin
MQALRKKLAVALVAGVGSVSLFGAAAFGAFGPDVSTSVGSAVAPAASALLGQDQPDKLRGILAALVTKGVISQTQADAILAALKEAAGTRAGIKTVIRDFLGVSADYLDIAEKDLRAKLAGTSLGALATASGKDKGGLAAALNQAGNADIDKALADGRITEDQAKKLRDGLPERVNTFIDRTWPAKPAAAGRAPNVKSFLGDLVQAGREYLGLPLADVRAQMRAGKSLGDIADTTEGKSRTGLIETLTAAANARIDAAVADKKLTEEQAKTLKEKVGSAIAASVDRKPALKSTTSTGTNRKP